MIFVVSTARSGTQSLAEFLDNIEGVRAFHQRKPRLLREIAGFIRGEIDASTVAAKLRATRPETVDGLEYAESFNALSFAIPALLRAFPGCRFIWLVRDGRDVVSSFVRFVSQHCSGLPERWPLHHVRADWTGDMTTGEWLELPLFQRCCWYWAATNRIIERELSGLPRERKFLLRLEFVEKEKSDLAGRFGLNIPASLGAPVVNQSMLRAPLLWPTWTTEQRTSFSMFCGELMDGLYPHWRDRHGRWRPVHRFHGSRRLWLGFQELARGAVYAGNPVSRAVRAAGARLPQTIKRRLLRLAGRV